MTIGQGFDIAKLAGDGRIAVGRRERRAGRAIRQGGAGETRRLGGGRTEVRAWLRTCGQRSRSLHAARRRLGIVYETDAKVEPKVKTIATFPDDSASAGHLSSGRDSRHNEARVSRQYLSFLRSPAAKAIFEKYGFSYLDQAGVVRRASRRVFELSPQDWTAVQLSLRVAAVSTVVALPFGIAIATVAGAQGFLGQGAARRHRPSAAGAAAGGDRLSAADHVRPHAAPVGAFWPTISASCSRSAGPARRWPAA